MTLYLLGRGVVTRELVVCEMAANKTEVFMVEELRREREASSLNISELTTFVDGGEMFSEKRRETCKLTTKPTIITRLTSQHFSHGKETDWSNSV